MNETDLKTAFCETITRMGASASSLVSSLRGKSIHKDQLDPELLKILGDKNVPDVVTGDTLLELCQLKTDVFLTHNWGDHQDNHKQVAEVNRLLKQKGLITWFDDEKMEGNVKEKMVEGIDNASCVVVFITQLYIDKVGGKNAQDNCKLEFGYATRRKTTSLMVPVLMKKACSDPTAWTGTVGMEMGGLLYVDMRDGVTEKNVGDLYDRILSLIGVSLQTRFNNCLASIAGPSDTKPVESAAPTAAEDVLMDELSQWLIKTARIAPKAAVVCSKLLLDANIATVERLIKKYERDNNIFVELTIDEDDAEDIVKAIKQHQQQQTSADAVDAKPQKKALQASELKLTRPPRDILNSIFQFQGISCDPSDMDEIVMKLALGIQTCLARSMSLGKFEYDCYISYRVAADADSAEKLFLYLKTQSIKAFLDIKCFKDGQKWAEGFLEGISKSCCFVPIISVDALARCKDRAVSHELDTFLVEMQTALDMNQEGQGHPAILPIHMGKLLIGGILQKFQEWNPNLYAGSIEAEQ